MEEELYQQKEPYQQTENPAEMPPTFIPPMADISWVKRKYLDIPYASDSESQKLDIYLPDEGEGPFALLIHIHGGGFIIGDKRDDHMNTYLKALHHGLAAASIEYRLSGEAVFPAAVLDIREAIRFLRVHAAEYHIDPEHLIAIGGSAGGNLSAMLGMNIPNGEFPGEEPEGKEPEEKEPEKKDPKGSKSSKKYIATPYVALAIDQFGPMNFATMDDQARANGISNVEHDQADSPESRYLGIAIPDADPQLIAAANPATYINEKMTDMLVQHGTVDKLVPYEQSLEFVEAIQKKLGKEKVIFIPVQDANHDDPKFSTDENMNLIFDYIQEHLK